MFTGIITERVLNMTPREGRWLDNVRKAFHESDKALQQGIAEDRCLEELFKAVDTAKTLRRSLLGEEVSYYDNKRRFIEFLGLEIPSIQDQSKVVPLRDPRTGKVRKYSWGEVVYDIRCKVHENENLNVAENVEHHILLDWSLRNPAHFVNLYNGTLVLNGFFIWNMLREVLSKFITGMESRISFARTRSYHVTISPPLGSIRPASRKRPRRP